MIRLSPRFPRPAMAQRILRTPPGTPDHVAGLRMHAQERLERRVAVVVEMSWQLPRECRCFDEQHDLNYTLIA